LAWDSDGREIRVSLSQPLYSQGVLLRTNRINTPFKRIGFTTKEKTSPEGYAGALMDASLAAQ
jgi:hypothetical protein